MTADTTNTSSKQRYRLKLAILDSSDNSGCAFPLYEAKDDEKAFRLATEGAVHESHAYSFILLSQTPINPDVAYLSINGDSAFFVRIQAYSGRLSQASDYRYGYTLTSNEVNWRPFLMTYGFALIELRIGFGQNENRTFYTDNLACLSDKPDQDETVSDIIDELTLGTKSQAIEWMLSPLHSEEEEFSFVDSGNIVDSKKSLKSYLDLCHRVLDVYEKSIRFFMTNAHNKVGTKPEVVKASAVRRFGRSELTWIAQNHEYMHEVGRDAHIKTGGKSYAISRLKTQRSFRDYDVAENRFVCAFLAEVHSSLEDILENCVSKIANLEDIADQLKQINIEDGYLSSLTIINACLNHEVPLIDQARELLKKAMRLSSLLKRAFPSVSKIRYRTPKRSKVFQEVKAYSDIYEVMLEWDKFGKFEMLRDGLVLKTWRMDKLYEYYVLYALLNSLIAAGFSPDESIKLPIQTVQYSLRSRYYSNEKQVANLYRLRRGDETLSLYYEPVIYGEDKNENGIDLFRTTTESFKGMDSHWTPDFALWHKTQSGSKAFVLDAKFRSVESVMGKPVDYGAPSELEKCLRKYKLSMVKNDCTNIDAVWLLCGRGQVEGLQHYQNSTWANSQTAMMRDGAAAVAPQSNDMDELLVELGLIGKYAHEKSDGVSGSRIPSDKNGGANTPMQLEGGSEYQEHAESVLNSGKANRRPLGARSSLSEDVMKMLEMVVSASLDKDELYTSEYARVNFGLGHPLLKDVKPTSHDSKYYTRDSVNVGGQEYFVFKGWRPHNLNMLKRFVGKLKG